MEDHFPQKNSFKESDRACLELYSGIMKSIARAFGPSCEVVLHSLEDVSHSILKIENAHITGRSIGAPMTDFGLKVLDIAEETGDDVVGPYFTKSKQDTLRSVTVVLRNLESKPIGYLCINMDLSTPFLDLARALLPPQHNEAQGDLASIALTNSEPVEHFASNLKELVQQALMNIPFSSGTDRNRSAIEGLYRKGIFRIKGTVDIVAMELNISKHTVYYYLREVRDKMERKDD